MNHQTITNSKISSFFLQFSIFTILFLGVFANFFFVPSLLSPKKENLIQLKKLLGFYTKEVSKFNKYRKRLVNFHIFPLMFLSFD